MNASEVIVAPTTVGYHCDGDCWESYGAAEGLINYYENQRAFRDYFVKAEWANEDNLTELSLNTLSDIHPTQDFLNWETVLSYRDATNCSLKEDFEKYPVLFTWRGKTFIFQGTHRIAAAYLRGDTTISGFHISCPD